MSKQTLVLGAGCFWCSEAAFTRLKGVTSVTSGYAGGHLKNPTYDQVCTGTTGHAEVVQVEYDPDLINLTELLSVFFTIHDPTTYNRQGADIGTQYRSILLYTSVEQKNQIKKYIGKLAHQKLWSGPIVTEVVPIADFYPAEPDHYRYYEQNKDNRYCQVVISPKLAKLRQMHANLL
ncbi:MAG: peptide-methionine (S)-S-oxide reductase MsrA [Microgenomates group bacterium]